MIIPIPNHFGFLSSDGEGKDTFQAALLLLSQGETEVAELWPKEHTTLMSTCLKAMGPLFSVWVVGLCLRINERFLKFPSVHTRIFNATNAF